MEWLSAVDALLATSYGMRENVTRAIKDFVALQGRRVIIDKAQSGKLCVTFRCTCKGCPMTIRTRRPADGDWRVKGQDFSHVNCTGAAILSTKQVASIPHVAATVDALPSISARALGSTVKTLDSATVPTWTQSAAAREP